MKKLITFDLDGTLAQTAGEIAAAANLTLREANLPEQPEAVIAKMIGHGASELLMQLLQQASPWLGRSGVADWHRHVWPLFQVNYRATCGTLATLYPGAADMLARLDAAGIRLALVSNKEERYTRTLLRALGLEGRFGIVIGGDSLPRKKPDALPIEYCLRQFDVAPHEAAHLGDSHTDVATARAAGVEAWAVPHGYNRGLDIADAKPDFLFASLADVAEHALTRDCQPLAA
ncbi:HAD-IA family hydrolase [Derxia gummosa]|uniref:phosphoglycolate phosphatase n=1 Tax=Derxia gummosa DSM 723 TaxID=1121388 RepID=A0A8B6X6C4_9BURK|nr:HAD-IA family hydrolase [Derxia gummosa]